METFTILRLWNIYEDDCFLLGGYFHLVLASR